MGSMKSSIENFFLELSSNKSLIEKLDEVSSLPDDDHRGFAILSRTLYLFTLELKKERDSVVENTNHRNSALLKLHHSLCVPCKKKFSDIFSDDNKENCPDNHAPSRSNSVEHSTASHSSTDTRSKNKQTLYDCSANTNKNLSSKNPSVNTSRSPNSSNCVAAVSSPSKVILAPATQCITKATSRPIGGKTCIPETAMLLEPNDEVNNLCDQSSIVEDSDEDIFGASCNESYQSKLVGIKGQTSPVRFNSHKEVSSPILGKSSGMKNSPFRSSDKLKRSHCLNFHNSPNSLPSLSAKSSPVKNKVLDVPVPADKLKVVSPQTSPIVSDTGTPSPSLLDFVPRRKQLQLPSNYHPSTPTASRVEKSKLANKSPLFVDIASSSGATSEASRKKSPSTIVEASSNESEGELSDEAVAKNASTKSISSHSRKGLSISSMGSSPRNKTISNKKSPSSSPQPNKSIISSANAVASFKPKTLKLEVEPVSKLVKKNYRQTTLTRNSFFRCKGKLNSTTTCQQEDLKLAEALEKSRESKMLEDRKRMQLFHPAVKSVAQANIEDSQKLQSTSESLLTETAAMRAINSTCTQEKDASPESQDSFNSRSKGRKRKCSPVASLDNEKDHSPAKTSVLTDDIKKRPLRKKLKAANKEPVDDSFDVVPRHKDKDSPSYAHVAPTERNHAKRRQLAGWSCKSCKDYFEGSGLSEEQIAEHKKRCSKHRSKYEVISNTPKNYWKTAFSDSDE